MKYYHSCELCGANLDPGEICDCLKAGTSFFKATEGGGMMKGSILKRLKDLEARYKQGDPLIVLARTDSGEEVKITMRECLERKDAHFIRVITGNNLEDLDLFLKAIEEEAMNENNVVRA